MGEQKLIFKIVSAEQWAIAEAAGEFKGAEIDLADGYIHFSSAEQAGETAAKHFAGRQGLLLVAVDCAVFGEDLKWEPSRGGDLFPHLYQTLNTSDVLWVKELNLGKDGKHVFPEL